MGMEPGVESAIGPKEQAILLTASFPGALQARAFYKSAKKLWSEYRPQLAKELFEEVSLPDSQLIARSNSYATETLTPSLECTDAEIGNLKAYLKEVGYTLEKLSEDFSVRANKLQFSQLVLMPGLAVAEGLGDVDEENTRNWLIGIGVCYTLSSDLADDYVDWDFPKHPTVSKEMLGMFYKLAAPALLNIGNRYYSATSTGDTILDKKLRASLKASLHRVSEYNKRDLDAQKRKDVPMHELSEIYDGKIGGVEGAVFHSIPSKRRDVVDIFVDGSTNLALATQVLRDDNEDLLGDPEQNVEPKIPNPSFFLTDFRNRWRFGERDYPEVYRSAIGTAHEIGLEYYAKLEDAFKRLPGDFKTRPFFKSIDALFLSMMEARHEEVLEAKTLPELIPQLQALV